MSQKFMRFSILAGLCTLALIAIRCANPTNESLKWRMNVQVPVTNENFNLADEMTNLFSGVTTDSTDTTGKMLILKYDTVSFAKPSKDTVPFKTSEDSLEDKLFHESVGPIPISNAPTIVQSISYVGGPGIIQLPGVPFNITLDKVYRVVFAANSNPLKVILRNKSTVVTLQNLTVALNHSFGNQQVTSIAPNDSAILSFAAAGREIDSTISITVTGTKSASAVIPAGEKLEVAFSINGMSAQSITAQDSLVGLNIHLFNDYKMSDSVDIDYIDISDGFFGYELRNGTGLNLSVSAKHRHLWTTIFSQGKSFNKYTDIVNLTADDSGKYYSGSVTAQTGFIAPANSTRKISQLNISGNRLFCQWQEDSARSVSYVDYYIQTPIPTGSKITLNSTDSLVFVIRPTTIRFKEMVGTLKKPFQKQSDTQFVQIKFPWGESSKDSLRNKFVLEEANAKILIGNDLPDRAYLDTVNIKFTVYDPRTPSIKIDTLIKFYNLRKDSIYNRAIRITPVVNNFPDSVAINVDISVPVGTRMRVINNGSDTVGYLQNKIGQMTLKTFADYRMSTKFSWEVKDTARIDLGNGEFVLKDWTTFADKLTDRTVDFDMDFFNQSNVYMKLYALLFPGVSLKTLNKWDSTKALTTEMVTKMISDPDLLSKPQTINGKNYQVINLLTQNGVLIPPRGKSTSQSMSLNEAEMKALFSDSICGMRWQLRFIPFDSLHNDALADTDYIKVNSSLHIQGTNSMDSLMGSW